MPGDNSKNTNTSGLSANQSRRRSRRNTTEEKLNEETAINIRYYGSSHEEENNQDLQTEIPVNAEPEQNGPASWSSLPHKRQLIILPCARLSEPLVQTNLRSYLFYQLKFFDTSLPDSAIASQAGIMQASFATAQLTTAMLWGRVSDRSGRKTVLLIGLGGSAFSCLGFAVAKSFWQLVVFEMISGALNGNVGVMRTMISEIVREKKYQSRAFLILPMCGNIGKIIGPIFGGLLADPAGNFPDPRDVRSQGGLGIKAGRAIKNFLCRLARGNASKHEYASIPSTDPSTIVEQTPTTPKPPKRIAPRYNNRLPFRQIFTYNVICTLISQGLLAFSMGTFSSIWYSFLSTDVYDPAHPSKSLPADYIPHPPFKFTGGIGLPPRDVGLAMSILGIIGLTMQLFLYPLVNVRLGTIRSWRIFLYGFPIVYSLAPFLSLIPSLSPPPSQKTGPLIWISLSCILLIQTIARTFTSPATTILINNCSPHPSVLGTIHGIGQTASSAAKTVGPALGGYLYGAGLSGGYVGLAFWVLAGMSGVTVFASHFVREGNGHEIRLEGDEEAEEEALRSNRELGLDV
ncbi:hypothetical protein DSL72_006554 [Monilinia vaccinii-corymbosi]|uniref:Major facilitator superfamily (MFS) profile domain-containing protein n=1 Tax=Monilinia vaccinii-corymbosi TaxID=61207 RepID=A0A8A3PNT2_9HELO|nr:hypothetical protein DSL72_006554 [Monilinia vaccinii-corymbosi]